MQTYPSLPDAADAPGDLLTAGHLWLQESIDGAHLRFRMDESGLLRFGDRARVFDSDAVPHPYRHAVRHVREALDRDALRGAVGDVEEVVFFGEATVRRRVDYDWGRTPPLLGFDVWSADRGFLPPDAVERAFDRLGLTPVNAFEKEVRARDFDPATYRMPDSAWYDGPAAGAVVRNKSGSRALLSNPDAGAAPGPLDSFDVERFANRERVERVATDLAARDRAVTADAVSERLVEEAVRELAARVEHGQSTVGVDDVRREVRDAVVRLLDERA